ncbi:MAG: ABC transporter ATP-binding protein [Promethearchaeota archaeon]|nr:MAG: ABC transporter ATP-binding protein [Candidatus Lokiarchaeota archaeon]
MQMLMDEGKNSTLNYIKWLFKHVFHHKILFFSNIIGIILVTYTRLVIPIRIGEILDSIMQPDFSENILLIITILFGMYLLRNFIEYATWMIGHNLGSKTEKSMRSEFFENIQHKPLSFHDQIKTGDLQALATNDLRVVNTMVAHGSFYIYPFVQSAIAVGLQYQSFDYRIVSIILPFLALYIYFVLQYRKKLTPFSKLALSKHADITVTLQNSLNGAHVTQTFCAERVELNKFTQVVKAYRKNWLQENRVQAKFYPLLVIYAAIGTMLIVGCIFIQKGFMTVGDLTAINLLLLTLIQPTEMIFWATKDMIGGFGASERLYSTISSQENEFYQNHLVIKSPEIEGKIQFQNVNFHIPQMGKNRPKFSII